MDGLSRRFVLMSGAASATFPLGVEAQDRRGRFVGRIRTEWDDDHRHMTLLEPYGYVDPNNLEWNVPAGEKIDGASIPRWAWTFIGGPYEGAYRQGSVVHDHYCRVKTRSWQATHLMFFYAMITAGVGLAQAGIMYGAVMIGGPKWRTVVVRRASLSEVRNVFGSEGTAQDIYARLAAANAIDAASAATGTLSDNFAQRFAQVQQNTPEIFDLSTAWLASAEPRATISSGQMELAAQVLGSQGDSLVLGIEEEGGDFTALFEEFQTRLNRSETSPEEMARRVEDLVSGLRRRPE